MANRRASPGFMQVSGYVPNELAKSFKAACVLRDATVSEALEQAIALWLAQEVNQQKE